MRGGAQQLLDWICSVGISWCQPHEGFLYTRYEKWKKIETTQEWCNYACGKVGTPPRQVVISNGDRVETVSLIATLYSLPARAVAPKSFFEGTRYSEKVLEQMRRGAGEFHSFPESVTALESVGTVKRITGADGVVREMLEIPGSYATPGNGTNGGGRWLQGVFQFIKEADGTINHRLFVPKSP
jgi:hypothetical protein